MKNSLEEHIWELWRQDDNGNISLVKDKLKKNEAEQLCQHYEAKGHKQTYWVQRENDTF